MSYRALAISDLICHSPLGSLCLSATSVLAVPQPQQVSHLIRMHSAWLYVDGTYYKPEAVQRAGHMLTAQTIT